MRQPYACVVAESGHMLYRSLMPLDPAAKNLLDMLASAGGPPLHEMNPVDARAMFGAMAALGGPGAEVASVVDVELGGVPCVVVTPVGLGPFPALVWIHGGAFQFGSGSTPWYDGAQFSTNGDVVLVRQYRYAVGGITLEVPAGAIDAGEAPIEGVNRDMLVGLVQRSGHRDVHALAAPGDLPGLIWNIARPGDVVVGRRLSKQGGRGSACDQGDLSAHGGPGADPAQAPGPNLVEPVPLLLHRRFGIGVVCDFTSRREGERATMLTPSWAAAPAA